MVSTYLVVDKFSHVFTFPTSSIKKISLMCRTSKVTSASWMSAVCIKESTADIYNGLSSPVHHQSWIFS